MRGPVLALLGAAAAAAAALPIIASAGPGARAPDLRADPVEGVRGPQVYFSSGFGAGRLLLRFDGFVTNVGEGPIEVSGNPQEGDDYSVEQRTWADDEGPGDFASEAVGPVTVRYETGDGHDHFHLNNAMRYSLWNLDRTAQVAPGQKVGFCLYDIEDAPPPSPDPAPEVYSEEVTEFCDSGDPTSTDLRMGTSPGWRDVYDQSLAFQWIDVSDTAPGRYLVGSEADPDGLLWEGGGSRETNAPAFGEEEVTVPGWVAQPVAATRTGGPQAVPLAAVKYGGQTDASLRYRVTSSPAHGSLNVPAGLDFAASQTLVYTPAAGHSGADSFTYVARSVASPFPLSPPTATVAIAAGGPSVTISGAPESLVAGTSAQLSAAVVNLPGGVTWSASAGAVSGTGLYRAPGAPPAGGAAVVRAASAADPAVAAEARIRITPAPPQTARPEPAGPPVTAGRKLLSPLRIRRVGARVVVARVVTGARGGRIVVTTTFGGKVLGRCATRIGAREGFTCKVRLARAYPLARVRVTARFTARGGGTAVRRAFVAA
jgi:hypothetical protein